MRPLDSAGNEVTRDAYTRADSTRPSFSQYYQPVCPAPYEVFQVLADRLFVAQVMMLFHQAVEQRLVGGAPHLLKCQWLESPQAIRYGRGVQQHRCRTRSFR